MTIVASLLMLASLLLPVASWPDRSEEGVRHYATLSAGSGILFVALLALVLTTVWLLADHPTRAWRPASLWLFVVTPILLSMQAPSVPVGWIAALGGGVCAIAASSLAKPQSTTQEE